MIEVSDTVYRVMLSPLPWWVAMAYTYRFVARRIP